MAEAIASAFFVRTEILAAAHCNTAARADTVAMKEISSAGNSQLKLAGKLHRRRHRQAQGLCLLEGVRLVQDALSMRAAFHTCFISPAAAGAHPALVAQIEPLCPLYLVSPELLDRISETVSPQSIVAVVAIPQLPLPAVSALSLVLDGVRDPGNAGTLLRTAAAAAVDQVLLGPGCVDPFNGKVMRAAMGAHFRVPLRTLENWDALGTLLSAGQSLYVASAQGGLRYDEVDWSRPCALVLGSEAHGASPQVRAGAATVAIPMAAATESLNVAAAGAAILFEAARQRRTAKRE